MNSPFTRPVNNSPPSVASMPAEITVSVTGTFHSAWPVSGLKRHVIAPRLAWRRRAEARLDARRALPEHELKFRVFQNSSDFPGVHIDEPRLRVECHQRCIGAARRPDFDRLSFDGPVVDIGQNRAAGL